jgi:hypothetical protein
LAQSQLDYAALLFRDLQQLITLWSLVAQQAVELTAAVAAVQEHSAQQAISQLAVLLL